MPEGVYHFRQGGKLPTGFDSKISPEHKNQKNLWNCVKAKLLKHPYPSAMIPIEGDGTPKTEEEYDLTVTSV
jgi:hypothetical protein